MKLIYQIKVLKKDIIQELNNLILIYYYVSLDQVKKK